MASPSVLAPASSIDRASTITPQPRTRQRTSQAGNMPSNPNPNTHTTSTSNPLQTPAHQLQKALQTPINKTRPNDTNDTTSIETTPISTGFLSNNITPARPSLDPNSPFVVPSTVRNVLQGYNMPGSASGSGSSLQDPGSVDKRMKAKLFGQGVGGGYLVSPMGQTSWKSANAGKVGMGLGMGINAGMGMGTGGNGMNMSGLQGVPEDSQMDPFISNCGPSSSANSNNGGDTAAIANWDGTVVGGNVSLGGVGNQEDGEEMNMGGNGSGNGGNGMQMPMQMQMSGGFGEDMGMQMQMGGDQGFGLGFNYGGQQQMQYPTGASVSGAVGKYPMNLGSGYAPSLRSNQQQSRMVSTNVHQQFQPPPHHQLPTPRTNQPTLSFHPASSPLPTMEPVSESVEEMSMQPPAQVGPAGQRMRQVTYDSASTPGSSSSGSSIPFGGMSRQGSMMGRSVSTSALGSNPNAHVTGINAAFTSRPLARMNMRTISTSSTATSSTMDYPISPHLYPTGNMGDGTPTMMYGFQPYMAHHRHVSNMSASTLDTPALDSSAGPSPAFSTQGHSPLVTPALGTPTNGLMPNGGGYTPRASEYGYQQSGMQRKMSGLAIHVDGTEQTWENAPLSAMSNLTSTDTMSTGGNEHLAVSSALASQEYEGHSTTVSPADPGVNQMQNAQNAAFQTYNLNTMPYDDGSANGFVPVPTGDWHPGMTAPGAENNFAGPAQLRHVSTSYINYPTNSYQSLQPPMPAPRAVSAGYTPILGSGLGGQVFAPVDMGMQSIPEYPQMNHMNAYPAESSYTGGMNMAESSVSGMTSTYPGGEEPATKKPRIKYPPIGKRLRPGPKPKPKTPKGKRGERSGQPSGSPLPYDPFVEIAQGSQEKPSIQVDMKPQPQIQHQYAQPTVLQPLPDLLSVEPMKPPSQDAINQNHLEAQSAIPKSYLESCYTMFMVPDPENGGAPTKRYRCNIDDCARVFPRKSAIHSHIQTHLEDKPFVCTEPECNAAFVRQHDLRRHIRIHSGTKPFPCPCGKGFARGDALMRHRQRGICVGSIVPMKPPKRKASDDSQDE